MTRSKSKGWSVVRLIAEVVIAIAAATFAWLWYRDLDPNLIIDSHNLPSPNGYDMLGDAIKSINDPKSLVDYMISSAHHTTIYPEARDYTLAEKDAMLAANAEALRNAREALTADFCCPSIRSDHDFWERTEPAKQ